MQNAHLLDSAISEFHIMIPCSSAARTANNCFLLTFPLAHFAVAPFLPGFFGVAVLSCEQVDLAVLNAPGAGPSELWQWRDVDGAMGQ